MSVASKNLFAALGSDDESDSTPVANSTTSKTEPKAARSEPVASRGGRGGERGERGGRGGRGASRGGRGRGGSRGGYSNEDAFKDRDEVLANRERNADEPRPRGGRGGRGGGRGREHDRHSATGRVDTQKATDQAWGPEATSWESAAPIADADRAEEKKAAKEVSEDATGDAPAKEAEKAPEEEEEPTQTYADYLASKMKSDFSINEVRKADQSKWEATTSLISKKARQVEEALFSEKAAEKSKSSSSSTKKSAPKKVVLEIEQRFTPIRSGRGGDRGGRGGSRGTGERGGRGRGEGAPRGRGRGEDRGGRGRGGASSRGGRGGSQGINVADPEAFPALG